MTNKELKNKISEKFVSIMRKLRNIVAGYFMQNCSPYFKTLIMACMKMMEKEEINFSMTSDEREATNKMFRYIKVPDRFCLVSSSSNRSSCQKQEDKTVKMSKDNQKLQKVYNLLDQVDTLLGAKDFYDKIQTISELTQQLEKEYKDEDNGKSIF